jgi:hypothetical protein
LTKIMLSVLVMVTISGMLLSVGIADLQRTISPGIDGTYPSPYNGKTISVTGVVTATGFDGDAFFLSSPDGGPWSGICVSGAGETVTTGEYLEITGRVCEVLGFTTLREISRIDHLGTRSLPEPVEVSASELNREERYEGVLVCVQNVSTAIRTRGSGHRVGDDSGFCQLDSRFTGVTLPQATGQLGQVVGISVYSFGEYRLNPRSNSDLTGRSPVNVTRPSWGRVKSLYK